MGGKNRYEKACNELSQAELSLVNACRRVQRLLPPARSHSDAQVDTVRPSELQVSDADQGSLGAISHQFSGRREGPPVPRNPYR